MIKEELNEEGDESQHSLEYSQMTQSVAYRSSNIQIDNNYRSQKLNDNQFQGRDKGSVCKHLLMR